ncbi:MAG: tetratricopeptide repeat protein [Planctomycetes bacterium]|nr:tetratricopeptide repeat protein [Planctomycetota bacterium]
MSAHSRFPSRRSLGASLALVGAGLIARPIAPIAAPIATPIAAPHDGVAAMLERLAPQLAAAAEAGDDRRLAELLLQRAELHRLAQSWRAGLADLAQAARLAPEIARIELARARLHFDAGADERAVAAARAYLVRDPRDVAGHALLARALARGGDPEEALAAWDAALALAPGDPDLHFARATFAFAQGGERRREALARLDRARAATHGALQLEELALRFEEELREWDAAQARVARLAAAAPRPELWRLRGVELLERSGRRAEALAAAERLAGDLARLPAALRRHPTTQAWSATLAALRARLAATEGAS